MEFPPDTPEWAKVMMTSIDKRFEKFEENINKSINFATAQAEEAIQLSKENSSGISQIKSENEVLRQKVTGLEERLIRLEAYGRRDNLLLHGIKETKGEDPFGLVLKAVSNMPSKLSRRSLVRAHRNPPGPPSGRIRPILVKFHHFEDRQNVWNNRHLLDSGAYITEDYPKEVSKRRRQLAPYLALAKTIPELEKRTRLIEDKLIIDGKAYTINTLQSLPDVLKCRSTSTLTKNNVTAFFSSKSELSNHHPCPLEIDSKVYTSVEQYYAATKAKHAVDQSSLDKILQTSDPYEAYCVSKDIRMEKTLYEQWLTMQEGVLKRGMAAKFNQNPKLSEILRETRGSTLAEATRDRFWGTGRTLTDPKIFNERSWIGKNKSGQLLMEVREELS